MKKLILSALVSVFLVLPAVANAASDDYDIAKAQCKEFISDQNNLTLMIFWIDGYLSAESDNPVLSQEWLEKLTTHMVTFCKSKPDATVMEAMQALE